MKARPSPATQRACVTRWLPTLEAHASVRGTRHPQAIYRNRISPDPIFLACNSDTTGGIYAINRCERARRRAWQREGTRACARRW